MHTAGDPVEQPRTDRTAVAEFVYDPAPSDYRTAVRRFTFGTWPGRRGMMVGPVVGLGLAVAISQLKGFSPTESAFVIGAVTLSLFFILPRHLARLARQQYEDMEAYGTCRTAVTEDGMTTAGGPVAEGAPLSSTIDWQAFPWYVETDDLFVLTTSRTRIYFALPKRGAQDPADVDRVRAVLDRHLRRL
ncbi:YcxB family protein [Streptomyces sp. NBC_00211]|uniref:YcxB family protein n=1 Tax=Streptomyces sp. NBC_00211 TaxID=2975683 RepID=UPI003254CD6D